MWERIREYDYECSTDGEIRNIKTGRILKQQVDPKSGYKMISLRHNKIKKSLKVHRLIAETFLGYKGYPYQVDHINRVRDDNRVSNLRWVTPIENLENRGSGISEKRIIEIIEAYKNGNSISDIFLMFNK